MRPKVSVVMASYNHAAFVRQSVESALSQSFAEFELVITDDGSRDGTAAVLREFADPRIHLQVFPENRGAVDALNDAITRSCGEYVAVLNSDDYFLPEKLARQVAYLDTNPGVGAVFGIPKIVDEAGRELDESEHIFARIFTKQNRTRVDWLRHFFESGNCLCHPTLMMRRRSYDEVGLYDPLLMNLPDFEMWIRICRRFDIHVMAEPVTAFRVLACERNTSAPSPPNLARTAWETIGVLRHYLALPDAELREIVAPWPEYAEGRSAQVALALAAIRIGRPGWMQFGLGLLRDCIHRSRDAFPVKDYFALVGDLDPAKGRPDNPPPTAGPPLLAWARRLLTRVSAGPKPND
jgi:glycosyltransferase involved in cell wall biosynthesis